MQGPDQDLISLMQALTLKDEEKRASELLEKTPQLAEQKFGQLQITPLMAAVCRPDFCASPALFEQLVAATKDLNQANIKGARVIHFLSIHNRADLLNQLLTLRKGEVDLNALTLANESAVYIACLKGNAQALHILIEAGANFSLPNNDGQSPLHVACQRGNALCVRLLLGAGAKVDAKDPSGKTPAHYLAASGCDIDTKNWILRLLLDHGAFLDVKSQAGNLPWEIAQNHQLPEYAQELQKQTLPSLYQLCVKRVVSLTAQKALSLNVRLPLDVAEKVSDAAKCTTLSLKR